MSSDSPLKHEKEDLEALEEEKASDGTRLTHRGASHTFTAPDHSPRSSSL